MTAFSLNRTNISRETFEMAARRMATVFSDYGVTEDTAIAVLMQNDIQILEIVEACRLVGARYVMLNWHATTKEIAHILADSEALILIAHDSLLASLDISELSSTPILSVATPKEVSGAYNSELSSALPSAVKNLNALAEQTDAWREGPLRFRGLFAYTSGSTGMPKGIKRNTDPNGPDQYQVYAGLARDLMHAQSGDKFMVAAPLYHSAPHALSMFAVACGYMDIVIAPKFEATAFLELLEFHKITHAYIVPTMMIRLLKLPQEVRDQYDLSSLKFAVSTGSPWPTDVKAAMIDWLGPIFYESYGASEIGFMTLISSQEAMEKPGSVGKILPGGSIKILNDDMTECPTGEIGTIYVHLPIFGDFNYSNTEGSIVDQRYKGHATVGDMGHLDEEGYLFIGDRKKDMIISGGANIFPAEIEAELIKMPEITDCAVFGAPDPEFGEKIIAAVECAAGATPTLEDVREFLTPLLAKFKMPRKLDIHSSLPREDSGKIFKKRLRDPYWESEGKKI